MVSQTTSETNANTTSSVPSYIRETANRRKVHPDPSRARGQSSRSENIRMIRERQAQRQRQRAQEMEELTKDLDEVSHHLFNEISAGFAPIHERTDAFAARSFERLTNQETRDKESFEEQEKTNKQCETEIDNLEKGIKDANTQSGKVKDDIADAKKDDKGIQDLIDEERKRQVVRVSASGNISVSVQKKF